MKALLGAVSMLVALAIVGFVAVRQLRAAGHLGAPTITGEAPVVPPTGTVREPSKPLQNQVASDVVKAMEQGAVSRREAAGK